MKGFKHTGKGPKYGSFAFPSKAGFGPSSGKVKSISGYSRRAPKRVMKKAVGGIVEDNIVEAPGFSDFNKGGNVKSITGAHITKGETQKLSKKITGAAITPAERKKLGFAKGGRVPGVSKPMTAREAMAGSVGSAGFNRIPKIGK